MFKGEPEDNQQRFEWSCPRQGCRKYILSWTARGLELARNTHLEMHWQQDKERLAESIANFEKRGPLPQERYNKLILSEHDINMFETHHIKIDEDCVIEGYVS